MRTIGNYNLYHIIGEGAFGIIYNCKNKITQKDYAMKIDKTSHGLKTIKYEASILKYLKNVANVAKLIHYGSFDKKQYMVLHLYGLTLEEYLISTTHVKLVDKISYALKMLEVLKNVHNKGILHRDIKPENYVFTMDMRELVLIDFGISKIYIDNTKKHKPTGKTEQLVGCLQYASINSHNHEELSRRDDIISLAYTIMYLFCGELPWDNIHLDGSYNKSESIKQIKKNFIKNNYVDKLKNKIKNIISYLYDLTYEEKPNYFLLEIHINNILENI